jgi:cell division protein FtsB
MNLPISFKDFRDNPISAIAFILILVVGYLYYENKTSQEAQIAKFEARIEKLEENETYLRAKLEKVNEKLLECIGK